MGLPAAHNNVFLGPLSVFPAGCWASNSHWTVLGVCGFFPAQKSSVSGPKNRLSVWAPPHCSLPWTVLVSSALLSRVARPRPSRFTAKVAESPPVSCNSAQMRWRPRFWWQLLPCNSLFGTVTILILNAMVAIWHPAGRCHLGGGSVWDAVVQP